MTGDNIEPEGRPSLERACSTSCTRAGVSALLFSVLAYSMLQPVARTNALNALSKYTQARLELSVAVDSLDRDSCWQKLVSQGDSNQTPEKWTIAALKEQKCEVGKPVERIQTAQELSSRDTLQNTRDGKAGAKAPGPPQGVASAPRIFFPFMPAHSIGEALAKLADQDSLTLARSIFQYRFGSSIYKWEFLLSQLVYRNRSEWEFHRESGPGGKVVTYLRTPTGGVQVPKSRADELQTLLTLADVRELAKYELPDSAAIEQAMLNELRFILPQAGTALNLVSGGITIILLGLLVSLIYFWLYQREARLIATSVPGATPTPATLFSIFRRSGVSRLIFLLLDLLPAYVSLSLTYRLLSAPVTLFGRVVFTTLGILILIFVILIAKEAEPKASNLTAVWLVRRTTLVRSIFGRLH